MRHTFYQANCFVTTSCIHSCLTQSIGDQKWWKVWSHLTKEGNTVLKTNMNERGLQSPAHHWLGKRIHLWGILLYLEYSMYSKPVTDQSSRKEYGAYLHSLWIWGRQWQRRRKQQWPDTTDHQGHTEYDSYMLCCQSASLRAFEQIFSWAILAPWNAFRPQKLCSTWN